LFCDPNDKETKMNILVTSASGTNGSGYGKLLAFSLGGVLLGPFGDDVRIIDPRGLNVSKDGQLLYLNSGDDRILALDPTGEIACDSGHIPGLNPGGGNFGPDGRYYIGLRSARTIAALPPDLDSGVTQILPNGIVPFPRGFAFGGDGRLFLASGIGPDQRGENTIVVFGADRSLVSPRFVDDPQLSPLDLIVGPTGNVIVSSEFPFGAPDAMTTVREYDRASGKLVRVFAPAPGVSFRHPRGLRFGPDGNLYCVARDEVVAFDYETGVFIDTVARLPRLNGQALAFFGH
jgi:DNA-binding beta-propeller fold protein YncE